MFNKDLQIGSVGVDVFALQNLLEKLKYGDFVPTGYFGTKTHEALVWFQKAHHIDPTQGYCGPITRAKLNTMLTPSNREILHEVALARLGMDITPEDIISDEVACAETVNRLHEIAFSKPIGGGASTHYLYYVLQNSPLFKEVSLAQCLPGDIAISPTNPDNLTIRGHVGIMGENEIIMSNDSSTGLLATKYNIKTWMDHYVVKGGLPFRTFRRL